MTRAEILAVYNAGPEAVIALVEQLLASLAGLQSLVEQQQATITQLTARVQHLENQLALNSRNSHKSPSSDGPGKGGKQERQTHTSRDAKSGRKPGGQKGHRGHTLTMVADPDQTVLHFPERCPCCAASLGGVEPTDLDRRQVFDLPPVKIEVTEHQAGTRICPECGCAARGEFPEEVTQPVQYGRRLLALVVYLNQYQLLPKKRVTELVADVWGATLSAGTVCAAVQRCFAGLAGTEARIQEGLRQARCVRFDETSVKIAGKLHWNHSASTPELTAYGIHRSRGQPGMDAGGILPAFGGRAMHDGWGSYFRYRCAHALCNAHHLRELIYLVEREEQEWAEEMIPLLLLAKEQVEQARAAGARELDGETITAIEREYDRIVREGWAANPPVAAPVASGTGGKKGRPAQGKARNLLSRLDRYERETLAFVYDFEVPFDNNLAERDLRMTKVQQKISGGFRSAEGAAWFARIRGYLSTMRKQAQPMLQAIEDVFRGHPAVPSLSVETTGSPLRG
jgi:transposase